MNVLPEKFDSNARNFVNAFLTLFLGLMFRALCQVDPR
tara:strand:+ start:309 stop:422 length:114 start_codon:yes stop_codon:yes gene_type:complete